MPAHQRVMSPLVLRLPCFQPVIQINGTISDERFASMCRTYEDEQTKLKQEVDALAKEIDQQEQHANDVEQFIT